MLRQLRDNWPGPGEEYLVLFGQMLTAPKKSRESIVNQPHNNTNVVIFWPAANRPIFSVYRLQRCSRWQRFLYVSTHTRTAIMPVQVKPRRQHALIEPGHWR